METDLPIMDKREITSSDMPNSQEKNKQGCNNYRGIALLRRVTYKVFLNCILLSIKGKAEEAIGDYQEGSDMEGRQ